jgi:nucleoside-diphosphate-sugar epimerase
MATNVGRFVESGKLGFCVNISSDAVYPLTINPITEDSPVDPAGYYGLAKYAGEKILERSAASANMRFLNLRITALYGPEDSHGSYGPNSFIKSLMKDRTIRLFGRGEEKRDHLYVDDAAFLTRALMTAGATGVFNLASGRSVPFGEVVELLRRISPVPFEVVSQPRKAPVTHRHFDVSRLIRAVPGFRCTPLEDGLRSSYAAAAAWKA